MSRTRSLRFVVWAAVLGLLAPVLLRGQTEEFPAEPVGAWRARLSERVDRDLAELSKSAGERRSSPLELKWNSGEEFAAKSMTFPKVAGREREPFLPMVETILREHGLPPGLADIAAVESGFNPAALSPKGARGLWQLMPETARRYGLVVDAGRDERLDALKSTLAAVQYLKKLYAQFGDWPLALAAYNVGEDRVERARDRTGVRDFWTLSRHAALPEETRRYVPAVLSRISGSGRFSNLDHPLRVLNLDPPDKSAIARSGGSGKSAQLVYALTSPARSGL